MVSIVPVLILVISVCQVQAVGYSGYTEYDGRPAYLDLNFGGAAAAPTVTGKLRVDRVCETGIHLTGVDLTLNGAASGPWENAATTIVGGWTGGDTDPCAGTFITNDPSYPVAGGFTVSIVKTSEGKDAIRLVRMPTGYGYLFDVTGFVYAPSGGADATSGSKEEYSDSGAADLKILELSVPSGIRPGTTAKVDVRFTNQGTGDAGPFEVYAYAFAKENYQYSIKADPVSISGLAAGKSHSSELILSVPSDAPSGSWDVKVAVDNSNYAGSGSVVETDENNNERWRRDVLEPETSSSEDSTPVEEVEGAGEGAATTEPVLIFERNTLGAVENNPQSPSKFTLDRSYLVTEIRTYHWNYGKGQAPGTIGIQDVVGTSLMVLPATGLPGMGGVPDAYWAVKPDLVLPPGEYTVVDSDPSTWSQNMETGGQGIVWVYGHPVSETKPSNATGEAISAAGIVSGSGEKAESEPAMDSGVHDVVLGADETNAGDATLSAQDWFDRGVEAFSDGRYEDALEDYESALKIDPLNLGAMVGKGEALLALDRYQDAYYCALEALDIDQTSWRAWDLKGSALFGLGRYDEGEMAYDQADLLLDSDLTSGEILIEDFFGGLEGVTPGEAI